MEQFFQTLPRPVLVLGAILLGIVVFMVMSPPHTICDTQREQAEETLIGTTKPIKVQKQTHPPKILRALEACYEGRTTGACHDYFQILKGLAKSVLSASSECRAEIYEISDIQNRLQEGAQNLVLLAWGDQPPGSEPADRFGPLQDSEIALFCYVKAAIVAGIQDQGWHKLRKKISEELPGEKVKLPENPSDSIPTARPATQLMSELDIWNRSLFSVRCENYL
ncbi:MAG: hypothetical protein ACK5Y2_06630 [Bdellovibrionales bacterium]